MLFRFNGRSISTLKSLRSNLSYPILLEINKVLLSHAMRKDILYTIVGMAALIWSSCDREDPIVGPASNKQIGDLPINHFQVIGSHNSYHLLPNQQIFDSLLTIAQVFPDSPLELDYWHESFTDQLETYGVRQFELDIYYDPDGGHYYDSMGLELILGEDPASGEEELLEPGMKLIHILDVDYNTTQLTFIAALEEIKTWSDSNPFHFPIMILIETKTESINDFVSGLGFTESVPWTAQAWDELDAEIRSVFNDDQLLLPEDVRGFYPSLNQAILTNGWPALSEARGKVMFCYNNGGGDAEAYMAGHPNLDGRVMFAIAEPGEDESAFLMYNTPAEVPFDLIEQGYLIRTRCDVGTWQARNGDHAQKETAFASGAHFMSTDYYRADPRHLTEAGWSDYEVNFDGKGVRLHPDLVEEEVEGEIE